MKKAIFFTLFLFLNVSLGIKSFAQQSYGSVADFEILPECLSNGKVTINIDDYSLIKFKVTFARIMAPNSTFNAPLWKPFKMAVTLGFKNAAGELVLLGSPTPVVYDYKTPGVFVQSFSRGITAANLTGAEKIGLVYVDYNSLPAPANILWNVIGYEYTLFNGGVTPVIPNPTNPTNPTPDPDPPFTGATGSAGTLATIKGIDIGIDGGVYFWGQNGQVTKGSLTSINGPTVSYSLFSNVVYPTECNNPNQIVGTAISSRGWTYTWFDNGLMTVGGKTNLGTRVSPKTYRLPERVHGVPDIRPSDIVAVAVSKANDHFFAFYNDGTYTEGESTYLGAFGPEKKPFVLPANKAYTDIVDIAISPGTNKFYVWYKDGTMSAGNDATDLGSFIPVTPMK